MAKSIRERVRDSFEGAESTAQAEAYSESVYATWKDVSSSLGRSALLIFLLIAFFELLVYQHTPAISIGSFTIANAPVVQIALPAIVAFIFYDGIRLTWRYLELQETYAELMKMLAPKQWKNDLNILIKPPLPSFWGIGSSLEEGSSGLGDKFIFGVNSAISVIMIFVVPIAFECQAYYRLIQNFGYHNIFLWVSLAMTIIFMTFGIINILIKSGSQELYRP